MSSYYLQPNTSLSTAIISYRKYFNHRMVTSINASPSLIALSSPVAVLEGPVLVSCGVGGPPMLVVTLTLAEAVK